MDRNAARSLLARVESGHARMLARFGITPLHPRTGMAAVGVVNGRPVWPVAGGSEPAPEPPPAPQPDPPADPPAEPEDKTDWKAEARKWEQRSKENAAAKRRLDELEAATASDLEKAQKAADANAERAKAATQRAVAAEVKALADGFRVRTDALMHLKDRGDLDRFVNDDGEIDTDAIGKELADVLKDRPDLAPATEPEPPAPPVKLAQRPTQTLRPGAAPSEEPRAKTLAEAIQNHYAT